MKRFKTYALFISCIVLCFAMTSCDGSDEAAADADAQNATSPSENDKKDEYDEYIKSALSNVENSGSVTAVPTQGAATDPGTAVTVDGNTADTPSVSSMDVDSIDDNDYPFTTSGSYSDTPTPTPTPSETESPTPTVDPNAPTPTPYITPDEFEVGKCCIYMKGESDAAYGTEIVTAINKVRKDLGYPEMNKNTGLTNCADRRTRELAASYSHTRPNGLPFYSLAPEHFKAEMLIINEQKGDEAVDDIIRNDPISKNLIFSNKYQSIGASSFKVNGRHYTVVAFGL